MGLSDLSYSRTLESMGLGTSVIQISTKPLSNQKYLLNLITLNVTNKSRISSELYLKGIRRGEVNIS